MSDILSSEVEKQAKKLGLENLVEVYDAIKFRNNPPEQDAIYLFGQTKDNESSVFERAVMLFEHEVSDKILIINAEKANGFPGYAEWHERLGKRMPGQNIYPVPIENPKAVNTLSESVELIKYATSKGHYALGIVAAQFHMLRAFMTAASEAIRQNPGIKLHPFCGTELPWDEHVAHSQGTLYGTRRKLVEEELIRINKYQNDGTSSKKPSIKPVKEILEYLKSY